MSGLLFSSEHDTDVSCGKLHSPERCFVDPKGTSKGGATIRGYEGGRISKSGLEVADTKIPMHMHGYFVSAKDAAASFASKHPPKQYFVACTGNEEYSRQNSNSHTWCACALYFFSDMP